jgi:hypothetical protein
MLPSGDNRLVDFFVHGATEIKQEKKAGPSSNITESSVLTVFRDSSTGNLTSKVVPRTTVRSHGACVVDKSSHVKWI